MANYWDKYKGKVVVIQLRTQPYIGITGEDMVPATTEEGFMNTPLMRGKVVEVSEHGEGSRMIIETSDPNPEFAQNKVQIDVDPDRDIGYLTVVSRSLIQTAAAAS